MLDYDKYLKSEHWKSYKLRKKKSIKRVSKILCSMCFSFGPLHLHHHTYKRFGKEHLSDTMFVCDSCHEFIHKKILPLIASKIFNRNSRLSHKWRIHLTKHHLWKHRKGNPSLFKKLALEFFINHPILKHQLNKVRIIRS